MNQNKWMLLLSLVILGFTVSAQGESKSDTFEGDPMGVVVDDVLAVVGEDLILFSEIEDKFVEISSQNQVPENEYQAVRCQVIDQTILSKVLKTHAIRDSLIIGPDRVEYQMNARLQQLISQLPSVSAFEEYYGKTVNQVKEQLRPLVLDALLAESKKEEITADVKVTPAEVKRFFYRIPTESLPYYNAEVELLQLVMYPEAGDAGRVSTLQKMNDIKKEIQAGGDFGAYADSLSQDPGTAPNGGDLGFFRKGQMVKAFEDVAFKLAEGELSRIVETDFGFHLIQAMERDGESLRARHILMKPTIDEEKLKEVKIEMDGIYSKIINDSLLFEYAVDLYSEDDQTKDVGGLLFNPKTGTSYFEIDELLEFNPEMYLAIDDLEEGEVSEPILFQDRFGRDAYRILYVQKQRDAHRMNLEYDFELIKERAIEIKQNEVLYTWLNEATQDVFIAIDPKFRSCPNMPLWMKGKED